MKLPGFALPLEGPSTSWHAPHRPSKRERAVRGLRNILEKTLSFISPSGFVE